MLLLPAMLLLAIVLLVIAHLALLGLSVAGASVAGAQTSLSPPSRPQQPPSFSSPSSPPPPSSRPQPPPSFSSPSSPPSPPSRPQQPPIKPRVFEDVLGHRIQWRTPPERIVSLSPNLTEILFAIGCDTTVVVGVTRYCTYPPIVEALPDVGGVADPSLEAVAALQPDLVVATRGNPLEFMESLIGLGISVYAVETRGDLDRIFGLIYEIGEVTGRTDGAAALVDSLRGRVALVRSHVKGLRAEERPMVYMGELDGSHWTAGPGSYVQGMIEAAGGRNVGAVAPSAWSALSLEMIVARRPEVWLGAYGPYSGGDEATVRARALEILRTHEAWQQTPLGRHPRILLVHEDRLQRPGPRVYGVIEELTRFLHPERWVQEEGAAER